MLYHVKDLHLPYFFESMHDKETSNEDEICQCLVFDDNNDHLDDDY